LTQPGDFSYSVDFRKAYNYSIIDLKKGVEVKKLITSKGAFNDPITILSSSMLFVVFLLINSAAVLACGGSFKKAPNNRLEVWVIIESEAIYKINED